jgi:hypothetical protein
LFIGAKPSLFSRARRWHDVAFALSAVGVLCRLRECRRLRRVQRDVESGGSCAATIDVHAGFPWRSQTAAAWPTRPGGA